MLALARAQKPDFLKNQIDYQQYIVIMTLYCQSTVEIRTQTQRFQCFV